MSLTENGGVVTTMPVAPSYGMGGGFGGFGNDGLWVLILLLCGWGGMGMGGWGGMGGFGNMALGYDFPWLLNGQNQINANTNAGFDHAATQAALGDLSTAVTSGFGGVQLGIAGVNQNICQTGNAITGAINSGFSAAEIAANGRQMASMQQGFALQSGIADLKYTEATEACATRTANAANTRDIIDAVRGSNQAVLDKLCALELDNARRENEQLRSELMYARGQASQVAQTAELRQSGATQLNQLVSELRSCPIPSQPVYGNQPIFTCGGNTGCGCGCGVA